MSSYDPEAASIFMRQALKVPDIRWRASQGQGGEWKESEWDASTQARARIMAGVAGRINSAEGVQPTPPYIKWNIKHLNSRHVGGRKGDVEREAFEITVFRLDVFLSGQGSFNGNRQLRTDFMTCLAGVPCTPIREGDTGLALVTMSRYRKTHRRSYTDSISKALVTEYGIVFELALQPFSL